MGKGRKGRGKERKEGERKGKGRRKKAGAVKGHLAGEGETGQGMQERARSTIRENGTKRKRDKK